MYNIGACIYAASVLYATAAEWHRGHRHWFYIFSAARVTCLRSVLLLLYGRTLYIYSVILGSDLVPCRCSGVRALNVVYIYVVVRLAHTIERARVPTQFARACVLYLFSPPVTLCV